MGEATQTLHAWWQYFDYCFNANPAALMCETFWSRGILGFIALGCVMALVGVLKVVSYRRKLRKAHIAEWERNSVDEAGIREVTWTGETASRHDTPDDELIATIRAGIEQRKREVGPRPS